MSYPRSLMIQKLMSDRHFATAPIAIKVGGSNGSVNTVIRYDRVSETRCPHRGSHTPHIVLKHRTPWFRHLSGEHRTFKRTGSSGGRVTYFSCVLCPTALYTKSDSLPGFKVVKATWDDREVLERKPAIEIHTKNRPGWCASIEGASQWEANTSREALS